MPITGLTVISDKSLEPFGVWLETLDASQELSRPRIRLPVAGMATGA